MSGQEQGGGFTADELEAIDADLSPADKNDPPAADAGDDVSVPQEQDPLAEGVSEERSSRWAIFDQWRRSYLEESVRTRQPTDRMRLDVDKLNAEEGFARYVWHRV